MKSSQRLTVPTALAALATLAAVVAPAGMATTNPYGLQTTTCPRCSASDGTSTGAASQHSASFEWSINLGLARYPKPTSYTGIGAVAFERDGTLPSFGSLVGRYFPAGPLQQSQIPMRINQPLISAATFHPSCLMLDSEAIFERIPKNDGGSDYIYQVVTDDAFTQVDILAAGATPLGFPVPDGTPAVTVGAGWQIRVWKKPAGFQKPTGSSYYDANAVSLGTPLTNAVICRPNTANPGDNTLLFILKETTGVGTGGSSTTAIVQTLVTVSGIVRPDAVTTWVYPSVVTNLTSPPPHVSVETIDYRNHGPRKWDYTLDRIQKVASVTNGVLGELFIRSTSTEVYEDFSATAPQGGEPGMKRLMTLTDNGLTTTYDYYRVPATTFAHGRPKSVVRSDGSWTAWEYIFGTAPVYTEYSSWKDVQMSGMAGARKKVTTVNGGNFTVETYVAGQMVAKSKSALSGQTLTESQWDGTGWHDTVTTYNAENSGTIGAGKVASVARPDGTRTTYAYSAADAPLKVTETSDSSDSPAFARKSVTMYNSGNIPFERHSYIVVGGAATEIASESWWTDTSATPVLDALGRPVRIVYGDASTETNEYACCGLAKHIARDGTVTAYFRDDLKRVWKVSSDPAGPPPAIVTTTDVTYGTLPNDSLAGITTTRYLGETTRVFLGATMVTRDGTTTVNEEPSRTTSEDDRLMTRNSTYGTQTSSSHKRRADTIWAVDSYTFSFVDGQPYSQQINTTGINRFYYPNTHSLAGGGLCTTVNEAGRVSDTYFDMLGRTVRTATPASGATTYTYHAADADQVSARGKVATVTDADGVTVTYGYPSANKRTVTRTVLATTDPIPPSTPSVTEPVSLITETTETIETPEPINGVPIGVSFKSETNAGQPGAMTLVSTSYRSLDGTKSATVAPGGSSTATERPNPNVTSGVSTTTTTHADLTKTVVTTTPTASGSTVRSELQSPGASSSVIEWTESAYDLRGRLISSQDSRTKADGMTSYEDFTESGTPLTVTQGGRETTYEYDYEGRVIEVDGAIANVAHISYWPSGLVKARWGDQTNPVWYQYNAFGQLTTLYTWKSDPGITQETLVAPNDFGNPRVPTTWSYGSSTGRLDYKRDANTKDLKYYYTLAGRLKTRVSARNITTAYYYDTGGNLRAVNYSAGTDDILHARDTLGRPKAATQGTLTITAGTSAVSNAGITLSSPVRSIAYGYDGLRLSTETTDLGGGFVKTLNRFYDGYGRPRSLAVGTDYTTAYGYDATTGRLSQVWERPYLSAIGDPLGEPAGEPLTRPVLVTGDFTYGYVPDSGLVHTVTKAASGTNPALVATRTWESTRDVLKKIENTAGQTIRSSYTYTVNDIGQRTAVTTGGSEFTGSPANWSWGYDALGQLEKAALGTTGDMGRRYQYDSIGNRKTSAVGNWNAATFTAVSTASYYGALPVVSTSVPGANSLNQYAAILGQFEAYPAYDFDGNMTAGPVPGSNGNTPGVQAPANATNIGWDAENRLISATVNSITYNYEYDHLSRLVVRKVGTAISRRYIHDGWNRIAEYESSATTPYNTYTWGLDLSGSMQGAGGVGGLLAASEHSGTVQNPVRTPYYPTYDGNGNISEYLDFSGAAAVHYEYDPFGTVTRLTGSNSTRFQFRFSTKPRDISTGLYYYGYRWYDPLTGRWPSRDPIEESGHRLLLAYSGLPLVSGVTGISDYAFVLNTPTSLIDADGRIIPAVAVGIGIWLILCPHDHHDPNAPNPFGPTTTTLTYDTYSLGDTEFTRLRSSHSRSSTERSTFELPSSTCTGCCTIWENVIEWRDYTIIWDRYSMVYFWKTRITVSQNSIQNGVNNATRLASAIDSIPMVPDGFSDAVEGPLLFADVATAALPFDVIIDNQFQGSKEVRLDARPEDTQQGHDLVGFKTHILKDCVPCKSLK